MIKLTKYKLAVLLIWVGFTLLPKIQFKEDIANLIKEFAIKINCLRSLGYFGKDLLEYLEENFKISEVEE